MMPKPEDLHEIWMYLTAIEDPYTWQGNYVYTENSGCSECYSFFIVSNEKAVRKIGRSNMEKENKFTEELAKELRKKKVRKWALMALVAIIVVSTFIGLNIEDKDSLLPDGQGNIITNQIKDDNDVAKPDGEADQLNNDQNNNQNNKPTAEDLMVDNSNDPTASNGGNSAYKPENAENITVTISIRCDTLSSDMSKLTNTSITEYIPTNGIILNTVTYKGTTDNTVFDVLNTVCRNNGIQLESTYTPLYESYYVEGINYLYEFDAGVGSGWMYKVNGWYPNYGCSSYYLSDGDRIEWVYTCDYGADVGGSVNYN